MTKTQLKQLIREALGGSENLHAEEEEPVEQPAVSAAALDTSAGGKEQSDVSRVLTYIKKIDNRKEFAQLLMSLVQHGQNVPGAKMVLTKLYRQLPTLAKSMQETKLNEDEAQAQPGGNWSQPGRTPPPSEGGEDIPPEQVEEIAMQVVDLLSGVGHNDIVDILNFAAESLGVVEMPPGPDMAVAEAKGVLREALIRYNFKKVLKKALK